MWQDVRFAIRALKKTPDFTVVAVITLALAIGATTSMFSVVDAVLLHPLPYPHVDRLVRISETFLPDGWGTVSAANLRDWRERNRVFDGLSAYTWRSMSLQSTATPERMIGIAATGDLFATLQAHPLLGRTFLPDEDGYGKPKVAVLSEGFWRRRFAADAGIIGKTAAIDGEPYTIVGVMPASFRFPPAATAVDLWVPLQFSPTQWANRGSHAYFVVARLNPGVSIAGAQAQMNEVTGVLARQYQEDEGRGCWIVDLREDTIGRIRPALLMLLGAVFFVVLIACVNVGNLMMARAASRRAEIAIRTAIGANRSRIVRQLLTESLVLAVAGTAAGAFLAWTCSDLVRSLSSREMTLAEYAQFDWRIFVFLAGLTFATAILFGLFPALRAFRPGVHQELKQSSGQPASTRGDRRLRNLTVAAEIALATVLLAGAGILLKTFAELQNTNSGLVSDKVLTFAVALPAKSYSEAAAISRFYSAMTEHIGALPGVRSAGIISHLPMQSWGTNGNFSIEGKPPVTAGTAPRAEFRFVSSGYFPAMRIPVVRGRDLAESDTTTSTRVMLINHALAARFFDPGEDPVGRRILLGGAEPFQVVGVVADVHQAGLDRPPEPELYVPYTQLGEFAGWARSMNVVVSTNVPPLSLTEAVRRALSELDSGLPIFAINTMDNVVRDSLWGYRLNLLLVGSFAVLALVLAAAGVYGVMSYAVTQRTREFGLRSALGANPVALLTSVLWENAVVIALGVSGGLIGAAAVSRATRAWLLGARPVDLATTIMVCGLMSAVALLAAFMPARRASRVDPMVALRYE